MTFQEAVDLGLKMFGGQPEFYEGQVKYLVALGVLKLDDMKPVEEYEQAIKAREIMDQLPEINYENTGLRR